MPEDKRWQFELEEYIRQGEPDRIEKSAAWQAAIGLQAVDGLKTSEYLLDTAKNHIEGRIGIDEAEKRIQSYYEERGERHEIEDGTKEADIVSARIAKLLGEKTFQFSPAEWLSIHRRLFEGVFDYAGKIRTYNITKKEWVLKGNTVTYAAWNSIRETLDYDFNTEKQFSYEGLSYMHLDYREKSQSVKPKVPKCQNDTLECTLEEAAVLQLIIENNKIKQNEIVRRTGKSLSTVKRIMDSLQKKRYIRRIDGKRYGSWEILRIGDVYRDE